MGKVYPKLEARHKDWISKQHLFFVSTAPLSEEGLVNCSPKGLDCFRILDDLTVAYLDLTGSGVETIAHLQENKRITLMFCAFEGPPKIVRLYGKGEVLHKGTPEYNHLRPQFPQLIGERAIIKIHLTRIADSCGFAVPKYTYDGDRDVLTKSLEKKGVDGVAAYQQEKNLKSLDGLPGIPAKDN